MANIIVSGDWWRLEDDGTLYVYCTGDMPDYGNNAPWHNYRLQITSAVISSSVTSIGYCAFLNCANLASVTIPNSVAILGDYAFQNCAMKSLEIPNSVVSIGIYAISKCTKLESVTLPNSITGINNGIFWKCSGLTSVTIPNSVASIGRNAFLDCPLLADVYYNGTEAQWNTITIDSGNDSLENATIHYTEAPTLASIAITTPPTKTAYTVGDTFSPAGMVVTATYSDASTATVTGYSTSPATALTTADTTITVSYTEDGVTETATVAITVAEPTPEPEPEPEPTANRIRIQVTKHNGEALTFNAVKKADYVLSTSFDGNDVQADEFSAVIRQTDPEWLSNWQNVVNRKSPVILTFSAQDGTPLRTERYYFKGLQRTGKYDFPLTAQSPIGRLTDDFPGGLYSAASLSEVLTAVIGDSIPRGDYSVNPLLSKVSVYGWIPYQERRTTLHQLALAYGFLIRRDGNNNLYFTVPDTGDPYTIPDSAIFTGGSVDYSVGRTYYRADITAYEHLQRETAAETLFDNSGSAPAENLIVRFDSPMFDLQAVNLTITDSGVNYAKVSGSGQLTGKPYTKIESVFSVEGDPDADPQHILSVSDVYLITSLNAVSVGERLLSYHNAPAVVNMDILRTTQRSGDYVSFTDPFGDPQTGYITALSGSITSIDRATASIVCEYAPSWDSDYDAVEVLTDSGDWPVPDYLDGKRIRVVLIGGGTGGEKGQDGTDSSGGRGGAPGAGGKIWDSERARTEKFVVTSGYTFSYSCGTGGVGGVAGTASTFSNASLGVYFSSDEGSGSNSGFYDGIEGTLYALPGTYRGVDGGAATTGTENGDRTNPDYNNVQLHTVTLPWDSSQSWTSGEPGDSDANQILGGDGYIYGWAYGGLGGGAAVGSGGDRGSSGRCTNYDSTGGDGGSGASAYSIFPAITYGCGGNGGHGGGAGGAGGKGHSEATGGNSPLNTYDGEHGRGGYGSYGQAGGDGCILIYYNRPDDT